MRYNNFLSWLMMRSQFKYQFVVPETLSPRERYLYSFIEKHFMNIDLSEIKIEKPIFIISIPRTGSSMLQDILCTHPDIAFITHLMHKFYPFFCAGDLIRKTFNLNAAAERYLKDSVMIDTNSAADPVGIWTKWIGTDPFSPEYVFVRKEDLSSEQIETIYATIKRVIWCSGGRSSRFIMKMPGFIPYLPLLNDLFPDAKYIHLLRDPRPCANSLIKLNKIGVEQLDMIQREKKNYEYAGKVFIPYPHIPKLAQYIKDYGMNDIRTAAHVWNDSLEIVESAQKHFGDFYNIRFEDIVAHPVEELLNIIKFCELDDIKADNAQFWEMVNGIGKTRHKNVYGDYERIEKICQNKMKDYGYSAGRNGRPF